jgi:hypothetical protein
MDETKNSRLADHNSSIEKVQEKVLMKTIMMDASLPVPQSPATSTTIVRNNNNNNSSNNNENDNTIALCHWCGRVK